MRAREAVSAAWASALATAVATRSVKLASRVSVSTGNGEFRNDTTMTPHWRLCRLIGTPTDAATPTLWATSATAPEASW